ncbi:MAG TPA: phosphopantetheine-binding protein [Pyrinomonadaceae bacterium]|jgi:acyl carrier protein
MSNVQSNEMMIKDILWQSLRGGNYNITELQEQLTANTRFDDAGLDSLDIVDFFLRVQDEFEIKLREEDYAKLATINDVRTYLEEHKGLPTSQ